jgi:dTMP kinase
MMGTLITFEGIEGCGKSTQAERLYDYLRESGVDVVLSREPGGTGTGEKIRDILLGSPPGTVSPGAEFFLFLAARAQLIDEIVGPALNTGKTVILDRYVHSTLAYQYYGLGVNLNDTENENDISVLRWYCRKAARGFWPDIVFLIDVPVEVGLARIAGREHDGIESRGVEFHRRVHDGFLALAKAEPDIFEVIDGTGEPDDVFAEIKRITDERLRDL